jgi:hypothetical protein
MREKLPFYFVLYLVALTALFAVTNERNIALKEQQELIANFIGTMREKPLIAVADSVEWLLNQQGSVPLAVTGLEKGATVASVLYRVEPSGDVVGAFNREVIADEAGKGVFTGTISEAGRYTFTVAADVVRRLPDSLSEKIRERLEKAIGNSFVHLRAETSFVVRVFPRGPSPTQFTLSVEKPVNDKGFIGIPYTKTIFVNGAEPVNVQFFGFDQSKFALTKGKEKILLTWSSPSRTSTPLRVTVRGNTGQGFGTKDFAEATFTLDIVPPRWNPEPVSKAFWGVPYQVACGVAGMSPELYTLDILVNGSFLKTLTPQQFPDTLRPSSQWASIMLRATADGRELLTKTIEVRKPDPPQQPRWKDQTLEGNNYIVKFDCNDVNGDAVTVKLKVSQPEGFQSRLSSNQGKSFVLTILDVGLKKPPYIEIRGTVHGLGGVREVRKTFALFY